MDIRKFALALMACLAFVSVSIESSWESSNYSNQFGTALDYPKIDSELTDLMQGEEELLIIVTLSGKDRLEMKEFKIKYDYRLINGLAGKASPQTIKKLADIDSVEKIYVHRRA